MLTRWDDPSRLALNLVSTVVLAVVLLLIIRAPEGRLGHSRWAKAGWAVFAVGLTGVISGVYIPVGAAVVLRRLRRAPADTETDRAGLPLSFRVGVVFGTITGSGTLAIDEGVVRLGAGSMTQRAGRFFSLTPGKPIATEAVQTAPEITAIVRRIPLGFSRTAVVVSSEGVTAIAALGPGQRRRALEALAAAGFDIKRESRWIDSGWERVEPWS